MKEDFAIKLQGHSLLVVQNILPMQSNMDHVIKHDTSSKLHLSLSLEGQTTTSFQMFWRVPFQLFKFLTSEFGEQIKTVFTLLWSSFISFVILQFLLANFYILQTTSLPNSDGHTKKYKREFIVILLVEDDYSF